MPNPTLTMYIGVPNAHKTDTIVNFMDKTAKFMHDTVYSISRLTSSVIQHLSSGQSVSVDCDRLRAVDRASLIKKVKDKCPNCQFVCVFTAIPYRVYLHQMECFGTAIEKDLFLKKLKSLQIPNWSEGWNTMMLVLPSDTNIDDKTLTVEYLDQEYASTIIHTKVGDITLQQLRDSILHKLGKNDTYTNVTVTVALYPYCKNWLEDDSLACASLFYARNAGLSTDEIFQVASTLQLMDDPKCIDTDTELRQQATHLYTMINTIVKKGIL